MRKKSTALKRAIAKVQGQSELARRLTTIMKRPIAQGHISYWLKHGVSAEAALAIAEATEWSERPHDFLPELYPNPDDALPVHIRAAMNDSQIAERA